jgi:Leucine Rich repeat
MVNPRDWTTLPIEIVILIGAFLQSMKDIVTASMLGRRWRQGMFQVPFPNHFAFEARTDEQSFKVRSFIAAHAHQLTSIGIYFDYEEYPLPENDVNSMLTVLQGAHRLQLLGIGANRDGGFVDIDMTRFPQLPALETLEITYHAIKPAGNLVGFCSYYSSRLKDLTLKHIPAELGGTWDSSQVWEHLSMLRVPFSAPDIIDPIVATTFNYLVCIDFSCTRMNDVQFTSFALSPRFPFYVWIKLNDNLITDVGVEALAVVGDFLKVRELDLSRNDLGEQFFETIAGLPYGQFAYLENLYLRGITPTPELLLAQWLDDMSITTGRIDDDEFATEFAATIAERGCEWIVKHG